MKRLVVFALVVGLAMVLVAGGACKNAKKKNDGGTETATVADSATPTAGADLTPAAGGPLAEYFAALETISQRLDSVAAPVFDQLRLTSDPAEFQDLFAQLLPILDAFLNDYQELEPPDEVQTLHDNGFERTSEFRDLLSAAIDQAEGVEDPDQLIAIFDSAELSNASDASNASCDALQANAAEHSITVDLGCDR